jgi:hypothetical protein
MATGGEPVTLLGRLLRLFQDFLELPFAFLGPFSFDFTYACHRYDHRHTSAYDIPTTSVLLCNSHSPQKMYIAGHSI